MRILLSFLILLVAGDCWAGSVSHNPIVTGTPETHGQYTVTVGDGGRYQTIGGAVEYVLNQTQYTAVTSTGAGADTVTITQYSDTITGDGTAFNIDAHPGYWIQLNGDPHYYPIKTVASSTEIILASGLFHATYAAGTSYTIYKPTHYTILINAGDYDERTIDATGTPANIHFVARIPGAVNWIMSYDGFSQPQIDLPDNYGEYHFDGIVFRNISPSAFNFAISIRSDQDNTYGNSSIYTFNDLKIYGYEKGYAGIQVNGADLDVTKLRIYSGNTTTIPLVFFGDSIKINDVLATGQYSDEILKVASSGRHSMTKDWVISDVYLEQVGHTALQGTLDMVLGSAVTSGNKDAYLSNVFVRNEDTNLAFNSFCIKVKNESTSGTSVINAYLDSGFMVSGSNAGAGIAYALAADGVVADSANLFVSEDVVVDGNNYEENLGRIYNITTANAYTISTSGAITIPPMVKELLLNNTVQITATIANTTSYGGVFFIKQIDTGTAGHTVTLTSGTWDGTNTVATFNADNDYLLVYFDSEGRGTIITNNGVVLS